MPDKTTYHNIIDGKIQASASGAMMDIINPATGEVYATAPNSDEQDVDLACRAAGRAFETWRWSTPSERQRALLKLADVSRRTPRSSSRSRARTPGSRCR